MASRRIAALALAVATAGAPLAGATPAAAAESVLVVHASGDAGWRFNPDPARATPYEFSSAEAIRGSGSLHVPPISNTGNGGDDQFVAFLRADVSADAFAYFQVHMKPVAASDVTLARSQFSVDVLADRADSGSGYDCRWRLLSSVEPNRIGWSGGVGFSKADVGFSRPGALTDAPNDGFTCPGNLFGMPAGTSVDFAVNVGDETTADTGVGAYIDDVYLATTTDGAYGERYYDFEPRPDTDGDGLPDDVDPDAIAALLPSALSAYAKTTSEKVYRGQLERIERLLLAGDTAGALDKLAALRRKTDGCGQASTTGKDDWIIDCDAQVTVRDALDRLVAAVGRP